jgi:hypothetical protein
MLVELIGEEIGYVSSHRTTGEILSHGFARVTKVNENGQVTLDNGMRFRRDGYEFGSKYYGYYLTNAARLRAQLAMQRAGTERAKTAQMIINLIEKYRLGNGRLDVIASQDREKMLELVRQL